MTWTVNKQETQDHWLVLEDIAETGQILNRAIVKWDGCVHYWRDYGQDDSDYIHICDLDAVIDQLIEARDRAIEHFGKGWLDQ